MNNVLDNIQNLEFDDIRDIEAERSKTRSFNDNKRGWGPESAASCIIDPKSILRLHGGKELGVRFGLREAFEDNFHLLDRRQRIKHTTHYPDTVEVFLAD